MKPLLDRRILITRARKQADELAVQLEELGAVPVFLAAIEIEPVRDTTELDSFLCSLESYDWLVLTSANAVNAVCDRFEALGISELPGRLRVAAVGKKTARLLQERGFRTDFYPDEYVAEALAAGLGDLCGQKVLLPTADIALPTLPDAIKAAGGIPHIITAYHTTPAQPEPSAVQALLQGLDVITFTSGSTVRNFIALLEGQQIDPLDLPGGPVIACIGPKTARAAMDAGFRVHITAGEYTMEGLLHAIQAYFDTKETHNHIS